MAGVAAAQDLEPADVVLRGVAFVRVAEGRVAARGTAAEASFRQAGGKVEATRLAVDLPPGAHAPADLGPLRVTAPLATGDLPAKKGLGWGGVTVHAARGDEARTERVLIDGARDEVQAPGPVEMAGSGFTLHSASLIARSDGSRVQFLGGVRGRLESSAASATPPKPVTVKKKPSRRRSR